MEWAIQALYSILEKYDPDSDDAIHIAILDALEEISGESAKIHITTVNDGIYSCELLHKSHVIMRYEGIGGECLPCGWSGLSLAEGSIPIPD